jgi:hypothetical protein
MSVLSGSLADMETKPAPTTGITFRECTWRCHRTTTQNPTSDGAWLCHRCGVRSDEC